MVSTLNIQYNQELSYEILQAALGNVAFNANDNGNDKIKEKI